MNCLLKFILALMMLSTPFTLHAQVQSQPNSFSSLLLGDEKLQAILMSQLLQNGYSEAKMDEEANAIESLTDKAKREDALNAFYAKYQNMALQAFYGMARLAKSKEAEDLIIKVENLLKSNPSQRPSAVPHGIALIYQQIAGSALEANLSPCMTWQTRLGCLFALLAGRECAYLPAMELSPNQTYGEAWHFPRELQITLRSTEGSLGTFQSGFHWPLKSTDHTMCVEMYIRNGIPGTPSVQLSRISAEPNWGYARASAAWSLSLNGFSITRVPQAGTGDSQSNCSFYHEIHRDVLDGDGEHVIAYPGTRYSYGGWDVYSLPRACWFRNLEDVYRQTFPSQPFPNNPSDPDTFSAASVDINSTVQLSKYTERGGHAETEVNMLLWNFGVLVVRDR